MNILDAIVERKRAEAAAMSVVAPAEPSHRSFVSALRSQSPALIAEVKFRSPSEGTLLDRERLPELLNAYRGHAQAISVLCDEQDFGGGYGLLEEIRQSVDLPILAKEFIVSGRQVIRARKAGADAVLLIAAILSPEEIRNLSETIVALGMAVLFEIHEEKEAAFIPAFSPGQLVIGINNRNLDTLQVDLGTTARLAPKVRERFPDHLMVAESGVRNAQDVRTLSRDVDGFLIGTAFLKAKDPASCIQSLFPIPVFRS